jgi:beta-carotene 3-hydroxylase
MYVIYTLLVLSSFFSMEFVAWFTHKYVMHGFLWTLHQDHHHEHQHFFERNDYFFLLFALPSCFLLIFGALDHFDFKYWIGLGIALYGLAYFIIHDLWIHQRIKGLGKVKFTYLEAIKEAHEAHHQPNKGNQGASFGLLFFSWQYYQAARQRISEQESFLDKNL